MTRLTLELTSNELADLKDAIWRYANILENTGQYEAEKRARDVWEKVILSARMDDGLLTAAARVISGASDVERDQYGECIRVWPKDFNRLKDIVRRLDPSLV